MMTIICIVVICPGNVFKSVLCKHLFHIFLLQNFTIFILIFFYKLLFWIIFVKYGNLFNSYCSQTFLQIVKREAVKN